MSKYKAHGEVYNVQERMSDEGIHGEWDDYPNWYEYEMFLTDSKGNIVSEWDSYLETYNGMQRLSKSKAEESVKEIEDDINKRGKRPEYWFPSFIPSKAKHPTSKRNKMRTKTSPSLRSMR